MDIEEYRYIYQAKVISVYDGDTITVVVDLGFHASLEMSVRLSRIDTPELRAPTMVEGKAARDFVREAVVGKDVIVKTEKDKAEKYGRYLANVYYEKDGGMVCLNDELVINGLAVFKVY